MVKFSNIYYLIWGRKAGPWKFRESPSLIFRIQTFHVSFPVVCWSTITCRRFRPECPTSVTYFTANHVLLKKFISKKLRNSCMERCQFPHKFTLHNMHRTSAHLKTQSLIVVFACCHASTWLSWSTWTWLLTGSFSCMLERTVHGFMNEQTCMNNVVGTIMINQQPCSCMIQHVVREWWNNKIEQRCHNNHELVVASSRILHVLTYVNDP